MWKTHLSDGEKLVVLVCRRGFSAGRVGGGGAEQAIEPSLGLAETALKVKYIFYLSGVINPYEKIMPPIHWQIWAIPPGAIATTSTTNLSMIVTNPSGVLAVCLALGFAHLLNAMVFIPPELTYLLPSHYSGELPDAFVNHNNHQQNQRLVTRRHPKCLPYRTSLNSLQYLNQTLLWNSLLRRTELSLVRGVVWVPDR
jgi:hypothetical protein